MSAQKMMEILFFGSIFLIFFSYFGYPLTLLMAGWVCGKNVKRSKIHPTITFIVTVSNEEVRIEQKLDNTLALDYPGEKLQILVASDGSTDRTNEIARAYAERGIELLALPERKGKENAQKEAVRIATGEIIVFSDVATSMEREGLSQLVSGFADPTVGCVSSEDRLIGRDGKSSGEGAYVKYEMWLRSLESRIGSLVGLSGSLFAARKDVCRDFSAEMQSDFRTVLNSVKAGLRGVNDPLAVGTYRDSADPRKEWDRKVRTIIRGLTVFFRHAELLNIFRYGVFSYQLFCHKLLRWLVPYFLVVAFVTNIALIAENRFYAFLFFCQLAFYGAGILGKAKPRTQALALVRIPMYFITVNASILVAWWRYMSGQRIVTWAPTRR